MINQFPKRQPIAVTGLELRDALRDLIPGPYHVAPRVGNAVRTETEHPLEIVGERHGRIMARLAPADQAAAFADVLEQIHLEALALGARHRVLRMIALAPGAGGRCVNKPAAVGVRCQVSRDALLRIGYGLPVAKRAARDHLPVLRLDLPAAHPVAVRTDHQVVVLPCLARPVGMSPSKAREVLRVHGVLVDVVAAGQDTQIV